MSFCNSKDPVAQVRDMLNAIPANLFDMVWVRVEENSSPGCSLTVNTPQKSCDYFNRTFPIIKLCSGILVQKNVILLFVYTQPFGIYWDIPMKKKYKY